MVERGAGTLALLRHHPVARALREAATGLEPHLVGGVLRDRLLGLPAADFDAVVAADGLAVGRRLAIALGARLVALGGERFAALRLVGRDFTLDLWDREGGSTAADLARRDFTVNAIALDLETGACLDPHGGLRDLRERVLRAVGGESFRADPLRVLRLPRLLVQLPGFAADPATLTLARPEVPRLATVAAERVREELRRLFAADEAHRGIVLLHTLEVYPGLWLGSPQYDWRHSPGEVEPRLTAVEEIELLPRAVLALRRRALGWADGLDLAAARWASTFSGLGPGVEPRAALRRFAAAGYLARREADRIAALLSVDEMPHSTIARRHFLHDCAELWPTAAAWLGCRALRRGREAEWLAWLGELVDLLAEAGTEILDPPALLRGEDVQSILGIGAGPEVGRALARVRSAQVEGRVRNRQEAVDLIRRPE